MTVKQLKLELNLRQFDFSNPLEKNELKEYSPMRMFKAENNLELHTDYRRKLD